MKLNSKAGKIVSLAFTLAVVTAGYFAAAGVSQAGWIYGPNGYTYCNYAYANVWCYPS